MGDAERLASDPIKLKTTPKSQTIILMRYLLRGLLHQLDPELLQHDCAIKDHPVIHDLPIGNTVIDK